LIDDELTLLGADTRSAQRDELAPAHARDRAEGQERSDVRHDLTAASSSRESCSN